MTTDLALLAKGLSGFTHPIRIKALVLLESEHSPSELAEMIGDPLGVVSYHVRMLRDYELVSQTRDAPKRGALEHFYKRTQFADILLGELAELIGIPPVVKSSKPGRKKAGEVEAAAKARESALLAALGISARTGRFDRETEPEEIAA